MISIRYFHRKRRPGRNFSIEKVFADLRDGLADESDFELSVWIAPFVSTGLFRRLWITIAATFAQRDINHVTGDIHFALFLMRKKRTVLTVHDCGVLARRSGLRQWVLRMFWFQLPIGRCSYVTVVSQATKDLLLQEVKCEPEKVVVIPNAITSEFRRVPKQFNSQCPKILQIGTGPNKNLPRVAEAIRGLDCELMIVGPLNEEQQKSLQENEIRFSQAQNVAQEALVNMYAECDIVMFASLYEGFGMPIIEGNAVGRPVITSITTSMPEVAGEAACLVDPTQVESIKAGVERIISDADYRTQLIEAGFQNILRFSQQEVARQYAALYRKLLAAS